MAPTPNDGCPLYGFAREDNEDPIGMLELLLERRADINQLLLVK